MRLLIGIPYSFLTLPQAQRGRFRCCVAHYSLVCYFEASLPTSCQVFFILCGCIALEGATMPYPICAIMCAMNSAICSNLRAKLPGHHGPRSWEYCL